MIKNQLLLKIKCKFQCVWYKGKCWLLLYADTTSVRTINSPHLSLSQTYRWKG